MFMAGLDGLPILTVAAIRFTNSLSPPPSAL